MNLVNTLKIGVAVIARQSPTCQKQIGDAILATFILGIIYQITQRD